MTVLMQLVSGIAITCLCVLLVPSSLAAAMARQHGGESTRDTLANQSNLVMLNNKSTRLTKERAHFFNFEKMP